MSNSLKILSSLAFTLILSVLSVQANSLQTRSLPRFTIGTKVSAAPPEAIQWSPQKGRGSVGGTLSGGRRGTQNQCQINGTSSQITLLVPDDTAGLLTTIANPSFYWHVNTQQPIAMTFVLQDSQAANPIYTQVVKAEKSGIVGLQLPPSAGLRLGDRYRWSVFVACGEAQPSDVYARSFIERVDSSTLSPQVSGQSPLTQASTFARAGIWYDAVSPLVKLLQTDPTNTQAKLKLKSLLEQAQKPLSL